MTDDGEATTDTEKDRQITKLVELLASANKTVSSQQRHIAEKDKMILKKDEIIAARDTSLKSRDDQLERNKDVIDEMKEDGQRLEMRMELWISLIRTYENIFTDFASGVDKNICLENLCARKQAVLERQKGSFPLLKIPTKRRFRTSAEKPPQGLLECPPVLPPVT